jgi:hypothetical protein
LNGNRIGRWICRTAEIPDDVYRFGKQEKRQCAENNRARYPHTLIGETAAPSIRVHGKNGYEVTPRVYHSVSL